jgi:hypothetical protein
MNRRSIAPRWDTPARTLRQKLEQEYGVEEASILMDRPPGGWSDLVTNQMLGAKLEAVEARLRAEVREVSASVDRRLRAQTWITTTSIIAGMGFAVGVARFG